MTSNSFSMRKMKSFLPAVIGLIILVFLFSCKKEEVQSREQPAVILKEVGLDNSMFVYAGNDLHLDAEIVATGKIAGIKVQITLAESNHGWDFVKTYTVPYIGLKNANFHECIDVPETARAGKYELILIVTDESGEKIQVKAEFVILKDLSLPKMTGASVRTNPAVSLAVSGTITARTRWLKSWSSRSPVPGPKRSILPMRKWLGRAALALTRKLI